MLFYIALSKDYQSPCDSWWYSIPCFTLGVAGLYETVISLPLGWGLIDIVDAARIAAMSGKSYFSVLPSEPLSSTPSSNPSTSIRVGIELTCYWIWWRTEAELAANSIVQIMYVYAQYDPDGNQYVLFDFFDFLQSSKALAHVDQKVVQNNRCTYMCLSTMDWKICAQWKDGSTLWEKNYLILRNPTLSKLLSMLSHKPWVWTYF